MSRYRVTLIVETDADCADDAVHYFMKHAGRAFKTWRPIDVQKRAPGGRWFSMLPDFLRLALEDGDEEEVKRAGHHMEALRRRSQFEVIDNEVSA